MAGVILALISLVLGCGKRVSAQAINSTTCDESCLSLATLASDFEVSQHAHQFDPFYTVPSNFSDKLAPGVLLTVESATDLANYTVPSGLTMSRILFTSSNMNGTTLPTSAYIVWPYTQPESSTQGYPLVAWAHGTSGLLPACAPSNYRSLQYHFMVPFLLALQGMAVVAPDYAGLGVGQLPSGEDILHPWIAAPAQANDLANAVTAARAAFPALLPPQAPFVVMGHSQGGNAAWGFAERQASKPLAGYRGSVAIAPPARVFAQMDQTPNVTTSAGPKFVAAVTAAFPAYDYAGMTALSRDRWFNVLRRLPGQCLPTDALLFSDVPGDQLTVPGWQEDPAVRRYAELTALGGKPFKGPLLVVAGEADSVVALNTVETAVNETCALVGVHKDAESIEMVTYEAVNHFPVIQASSGRWLGWVKERLGTGPVPKAGCVRERVRAFRPESTFQSLTPNFMDTWVPPMEAWKYSL